MLSNRMGQVSWGAAALILALAGGAHAQFWPGEGHKVERVLQEGAVNARRAAVRKLALLSPSMARPSLERAMRDEDLDVRLVASRTCRLFRVIDLQAVVLDWLKSAEAEERLEAVRYLAEDPNEEVMQALESVAADASRDVREALAVAWGRVPDQFLARASAKLLGLLDDPDTDVRVEAAASLGRVGDGQVALSLASHLQDPDAEVREQVAVALGAIGEESAVPALLGALSDAQDSVVAAVAGSLGLLATEQATFGLLSLAEKSPHKLQARRALEALVSLPEPRVRQVVLELLTDRTYRPVLQAALEGAGPAADVLLEECVTKHASDVVAFCAERLAERDGDLSGVLRAHKRGTLATAQLFDLFRGRADSQVIVLALEQLSSAEERGPSAALRYLASLEELPAIAQGPLEEAAQGGRGTADVSEKIFAILARVRSKNRGLFAEPLLDASLPSVRAAAAELLVARGLAGKKLEALLVGPQPVSTGALQGLSHGMTASQATLLTRLLTSGVHGRRKAFLSVLWAFPRDLPDPVLTALLEELRPARGADRDALLTPLVLGGNPAVWRRLMTSASHEDLLKIAQLTWFEPSALPVAKQLLRQGDPRVASLAVFSVGRHGGEADAVPLFEWARQRPAQGAGPVRPSYARAAAFSALSLLARRGKLKDVPPELLGDSDCGAGNVVVRSQAVRLAAALGRSCAGTTLTDLLLRDPDARLRRLAALLLRDRAPDSRALVRCGLYETRADIASLCRDRWPRLPREEGGHAGIRVVRLQAAGGGVAKGMPASTWIKSGGLAGVAGPGFALPLFSDRGGDLLLSEESEGLVDATWYY